MDAQEKALYHQIHPLKLATDISAEIISLYFFWQRKLIIGCIAAIGPPIVTSTLLMRWANLEPYKQSAFGRYIRTSMSSLSVSLRIAGTIVTHIGAWYRRPWLIPLGFGLVLLGWLRGLLVQNVLKSER